MTVTERERFERYVHEVADQLRSEGTCLPQILMHPRLQPLQGHLEGVQTYEELFRLLILKGVLVPDDFSVLRELLLELQRSELLHPLYEDFGGKGRKLDSGGQTATSISRIPQSQCPRQRVTGSSSEFRFLLYRIGSNISVENLKTTLFLVRDLLPRSKMENLEEGSDLLELVRQRNCIHEQRPEFLYTLLRDIGRDDLHSLVDEYVYGHLRVHQPLPEDHQLLVSAAGASNCRCRKRSEGSAETGDVTRRFQQSYKYRLALKQLADKLCRSDLESMKHLCSGIIPKQQLEKVGQTLDLFVTLEDHNLLSLNDITFLEELLKEKQHLLQPLHTQQECSQSSSRKNSHTQQLKRPLADNLHHEYKLMLRKLGVGLGEREIKELKRLQHERNHNTEEVETGFELLQHWEEMGFVSQHNTDFLQKCLTTIGRRDLLMHTIAFHHSVQMQLEVQEKSSPNRITTFEGQTTLPTPSVNSNHTMSDGRNVCNGTTANIPLAPFMSDTASSIPTPVSIDSSRTQTASCQLEVDALTKQVSEMSQKLRLQSVTTELQGELLKLHRDLRSKTDQILLLDQRNRYLEEQLRETQIRLLREQRMRQKLELTNTTLQSNNDYLEEENPELYLQVYEERVAIHRMQKELRAK